MWRTLRLWVVLVCGVGAGWGCGSSPASNGRLAYVGRSALGEAFADSSINVSVYRHEAVTRLPGEGWLVSFYDPEGCVKLAVLGADREVRRTIRVLPRIEERLLGDGHCVVSAGLSGDGTLHLIYGAHGTIPYYTAVPLATLTEGGSDTLTATAWPHTLTYPQFYTVGGELQLWFRLDPASDLCRSRYDPAARRIRTDFEAVLSGQDSESVYMDQLAVRGARVGAAWVYRLPLREGRVINEGIYLAHSPDGGAAWSGLNGAPVPLPVKRAGAPRGLPLPVEVGLLNQCTSAFGPDGRMYASYYRKDGAGVYQIYLAVVDFARGSIQTEVVSKNATAYELMGRGSLSLPLSRPEVAVSERFVHVVYRQDAELVVASRRLSDPPGAWDAMRPEAPPLGFWEPNFDPATWEAERRLLLYVQTARQGERDTVDRGPSATAFLYEFRESN